MEARLYEFDNYLPVSSSGTEVTNLWTFFMSAYRFCGSRAQTLQNKTLTGCTQANLEWHSRIFFANEEICLSPKK